MRFWREIIADRYSGGVLGLLLALSFVVQVTATGWAAAAMVAPDPLAIICTASPDGVHAPATPDTARHDCPCSQLCGAGVHPQALISPSDAGGLLLQFADRIDRVVDPAVAPAATVVVGPYQARAPPVFLV